MLVACDVPLSCSVFECDFACSFYSWAITLFNCLFQKLLGHPQVHVTLIILKFCDRTAAALTVQFDRRLLVVLICFVLSAVLFRRHLCI